jgi:hypothetical protein
MEYQKRLRFIEFIKNNFFVKKDDFIVFYFGNYEDLHLITAKNIKNTRGLGEYYTQRMDMNLGTCLLMDTFNDGAYLDFKDAYLRYEEDVSKSRCIFNCLNEPIQSSTVEVRKELEELVRLLSGEEVTDEEPNC